MTAGSNRPPTVTGKPDVVCGGLPSAETIVQSKAGLPETRFAARSGSTAEATHMIEQPEKTSSVSRRGDGSGVKIEGI